jgi:hypothetical protein
MEARERVENPKLDAVSQVSGFSIGCIGSRLAESEAG